MGVGRWVGERVQGQQTESLIHDVLKCSLPNESPSYWPAVSGCVSGVCVRAGRGGWVGGSGEQTENFICECCRSVQNLV